MPKRQAPATDGTSRRNRLRVTPEDLAIFRASVSRVAPLDDASFARALPLLRARELARGEHLLRAGQMARDAAVVTRGLVREHFVMRGGIERTKAFVPEGGMTGSLADLISGVPSRAFIVAEEPTRLLVVPYPAMLLLYAQEPQWSHFGKRFLELLLLAKAEREYELLGMDAAARYAIFSQRFPGLEARVAARHVASYLGITSVHLSRLRRQRRSRARRDA